ncbi:MAG: hypothetical protein GXP10_10660 [Gammaproteobacteria bacterium]|nr:hypothetical protein [Gammaproteobacteria bacterium]
MADMINRNKAFLYKLESGKGVDATPVPANDLIVPSSDINIEIATEQDSGEGEIKGTWGPGASVTMKQGMSLPVETRVRGLGKGASALLLPSIHPMLMASAHTVVSSGDGVATARKAVYTPTSAQANLQSASGYFYEDGALYKLLGAVNDLSFEATMSVLLAKGNVQAGYAVPTTAAVPAITAPTQEIYRMTSALCTVTDGPGEINVGAFTFDLGVSIEEDYATGVHFFELVDRNPTITIDPKAVAGGTEWAALSAATSAVISATFYNSLGETLIFDFPKAVSSEVKSGTRAGRITREKTFSLKESSGDDQYTITWNSVL